MFSLIVATIGSKLRLPGKGGEKGGDRVDGRLSRNSSGRYKKFWKFTESCRQ